MAWRTQGHTTSSHAVDSHTFIVSYCSHQSISQWRTIPIRPQDKAKTSTCQRLEPACPQHPSKFSFLSCLPTHLIYTSPFPASKTFDSTPSKIGVPLAFDMRKGKKICKLPPEHWRMRMRQRRRRRPFAMPSSPRLETPDWKTY